MTIPCLLIEVLLSSHGGQAGKDQVNNTLNLGEARDDGRGWLGCATQLARSGIPYLPFRDTIDAMVE